MIAFNNLGRQYQTIKNELLDIQDKVLSSGQVLDGNYTEQFERAIASRTNRRYALTVGSCTQALQFAVLASNTDSPITLPILSYIATYNAVRFFNHRSFFLDTDKDGLIDLTDANGDVLLYVNLYGNVLDPASTKNFSFVIEDAAQSFGASFGSMPSGSFGKISCLSFDPTKNLPNYGSGGMLLTDDYDIYLKTQNLKANGKASGFTVAGTNSRMSEVDCAAMLVKLNHFDLWQKRRADIANHYTTELQHLVNAPRFNASVIPSWHKYVITTDKRDLLKNHLANHAIETKIHYERLMEVGHFPIATELCNTALSLPIYPELTDAEVETVVDKIKQFWK